MKQIDKNSSIEEIRAYIKEIEQRGKNSNKEKFKQRETESDILIFKQEEKSFNIEKSKLKEENDTDIEKFDKLKTKVLKYITYKKRTEKEVRTKFSSSDVDQNLLEDVIDNLKEIGYINDKNYIQRAINEFLAINTYSLKEIKNKLYAKGMSSDIIDTYFEENAEELEQYELKCAKKIATKKQSQMEKQDIEAFLYRKGYTKESIKQAFD